jgi:hypothetical protein
VDLTVSAFSGVFLLAFLAALLRTRSPRHRVKTTRAWLISRQVPWDTDIAEVVEETLMSQRAAALGGFAAGVALAAVAHLWVGNSISPLTWLAWVGLAGVLTATLAQGVHALRLEVAWPPTPVTVAHATVRRVSDHVSRGLLITVRASLAASILLLVITSQLPQWQGSGLGVDEVGVVWVGIGVETIAWLFAELVSRKVVDRPHQPASSLSLAWEDALRGHVIATLFLGAASTAFFSTMSAAYALPVATAFPAWGLPLRLGLAVVGSAAQVGGCVAVIVARDPVVRRWTSPEIKINRRTGLPVSDAGRR